MFCAIGFIYPSVRTSQELAQFIQSEFELRLVLFESLQRCLVICKDIIVHVSEFFSNGQFYICGEFLLFKSSLTSSILLARCVVAK